MGMAFHIYIGDSLFLPLPLSEYLWFYGSIRVSFFSEFCKECQYYFERGFLNL